VLLLVNLWGVLVYAQSGKHPSTRVSITIDDIDLDFDDPPKLTLDHRYLAILDARLRRGKLNAALFIRGMSVDGELGRNHLLEWELVRRTDWIG
jgi:hypothetical protein